MSVIADRRAIALLHLVCLGCVGRLSLRAQSTESAKEKNVLLRVLSGSVRRLLDTPAFSLNRIDAADLSWRAGKVKREERDDAVTADTLIDDADYVELPGSSGGTQDWSSVGYDLKYQGIRRLEARCTSFAVVEDDCTPLPRQWLESE
jgi:hypothetical protein